MSTPVTAFQSLGVAVLDAQARLIGANQTYRDWLPRDEFRELVDSGVPKILAGQASLEWTLPGHATVRLDRLDGAAGSFVLVTLQRHAHSHESLARDALTNLPDRRAVAARAAAWRRDAAPTTPRFAVLFLDLDDFKQVNDRHGHAVGDAVLKALAERWVDCVRDGDLVARYGGDEFVVLVQGATTPEEIEPVVRRLENAARQPVNVGDLSLQVSGTVGWSTPVDADWTIDALVAAADRDMYARKGRVIR